MLIQKALTPFLMVNMISSIIFGMEENDFNRQVSKIRDQKIEIKDFKNFLGTDNEPLDLKFYAAIAVLVKYSEKEILESLIIPEEVKMYLFDLIENMTRFQQTLKAQRLERLNEQLLFFVSNDKINILMILDEGADINAQDSYGRTSLIIAAQKGFVELAKLLLLQGARVNMQNHESKTALWESVRENHDEIVSLLLRHHADPNIADKWGTAPLDQVITYNLKSRKRGNIIELLLESGALVNNPSFTHDRTLLLNACRQDDSSTIELLLKYYANPNVPDNDGNTPLMAAVDNRNYPITALLIHYGADVNATNNRGRRALGFAIVHDDIALYNLLLQFGATNPYQIKKTFKPPISPLNCCIIS